VIFRAELLDAEGRMLAAASALRPIQSYKDWEKGETAARQRLLAALGFGGEAFDEDEAGDQEDQGLRHPDRPQARVEQRPSEPQPAAQERQAVSEPIPASLLRQIEHQARLKGVEPPAVTTVAEAKAALKRLLGA